MPVAFVDDDRYQLGTWVTNQRRKYARNDLSHNRTARLKKLRGWTWKAANPKMEVTYVWSGAR